MTRPTEYCDPVRPLNARTWPVVAALLVLSTACSDAFGKDSTFEGPPELGPAILVDLVHSRKQNPEDYRLQRNTYSYQGVHGYARVFDHLDHRGYDWSSIRAQPLSDRTLKGFDVLFINLLDESRPDFSADERRAIHRFVRRGGGLFVIADHTNVYRHAERLNRVLEPMEIRVPYQTAVDYPPKHSVAGLGWLKVHNFERHPVTEGLRVVSPQTGAPLVTEHGIAFTSDRSFGDDWNPDDDEGFYGNWSRDDDEPEGPLPFVAARQFGEGRVVVVGDQNIFGDAWVHFADNFELAMNAFDWLTGESAPTPVSDIPGLDVAIDLPHNGFRAGKSGAEGFYAHYVNWNRLEGINGLATLDVEATADVKVLLDPKEPFGESEGEHLVEFMESGGTALLTMSVDDPAPAALDLLGRISPDWQVRIDGKRYSLSEADRSALSGATVPKLDGPLPIVSNRLEIDELEVGAEPADSSSPRLLDLETDWGKPFIHARHRTGRVTIARWKEVGLGALIVFFQDGFWRNRTLGSQETTEPDELARDAVDLQFALMEFLKRLESR